MNAGQTRGEATMNGAPRESRPWYRSRSALVLLGFVAIAAFFLVTEHRAHLLGVLPYLLLLACPLMHFFHGHGRGGDHGHGSPGSSPEGGRR
jgi:hypothetical protein